MKTMIVIRRLSQAFFLALFVYILWSTTYPLSGILPPGTFFKLDPLLVLITSVSERVIIPGFMVALAMLAVTLILGRFFCGWVCPLGTSIDMVGALRRRHRALNDTQNRIVRRAKFWILGAVTVAALFGKQAAWLFDPIVLAARFVSLNLIPTVTIILNKFFIVLIRDFHIEGAVRDLYRSLKPTILGVKTEYFSHAGIICVYFLVVVGVSLVIRRFWCRSLCPLGASYALLGRFAPLHRVVDKCIECGRCSIQCRTGAIKENPLLYEQGECVLCMDCVYTCPVRGVAFRFGPPSPVHGKPEGASADKSAGNHNTTAGSEPSRGVVSRKQFLALAASSIAAYALAGCKRSAGSMGGEGEGGSSVAVIRPPAALEERDFTGRCVRCGNCMKVCITNGLQPVMLESGYGGLWTPRLVPETGYCEYHCTLCGRTCPTGAIPPLSLDEKMRTRLGTAEIDRSKCIPYAQGRECIVCQEHCPIPEKAIKLRRDPKTGVQLPKIDEYLCVGCGICQNKCPVRPIRAVRVSPRNSDRTAVTARPKA